MASKLSKEEAEKLAKQLWDLHRDIERVNEPLTEEDLRDFYHIGDPEHVAAHDAEHERSKPYLNEEELTKRRVAFAHCEDESCGFLVEFKHPNCTFFTCKGCNRGFNLDLATVPAAGVECAVHGTTERYDLIAGNNVCPACGDSMLAILSTGIAPQTGQ